MTMRIAARSTEPKTTLLACSSNAPTAPPRSTLSRVRRRSNAATATAKTRSHKPSISARRPRDGSHPRWWTPPAYAMAPQTALKYHTHASKAVAIIIAASIGLPMIGGLVAAIGSSSGFSEATWDEKSTYECPINGKIDLEDVDAKVKDGPVIKASLNCEVTIKNSKLRGREGIIATGRAKIKLKNVTIITEGHAVKVGTFGEVKVDGGKLESEDDTVSVHHAELELTGGAVVKSKGVAIDAGSHGKGAHPQGQGERRQRHRLERTHPGQGRKRRQDRRRRSRDRSGRPQQDRDRRHRVEQRRRRDGLVQHDRHDRQERHAQSAHRIRVQQPWRRGHRRRQAQGQQDGVQGRQPRQAHLQEGLDQRQDGHRGRPQQQDPLVRFARSKASARSPNASRSTRISAQPSIEPRSTKALSFMTTKGRCTNDNLPSPS